MRSNRDLQLVTEYNEKFFDYKDFVDRLSDQLAKRKIFKEDVNTEIQKYCKIHKGCDPDLILEDVQDNAYFKMDYQNDVLRTGINKMKSVRSNIMNNSINATSGKNTVTFQSASDIYKTLVYDSQDLYCIDSETYLFGYNAAGAIAYYDLDMSELMELAAEAKADDLAYISEVLGAGGYIIDTDNYESDPNIEYDDGITEILDYLENFVGEEFLYANVNDLV